jgi:hypothetical protein
MVKRVKVHSMDALKDSNYRFPLNYGVEKFLELFSGACDFCFLYPSPHHFATGFGGLLTIILNV